MPKGSKVSLREHLKQVEKTLKRKPKQLAEAPPPPEGITYLWEWYLEMRTGEPLTFSEIRNWSDLTKQELKAWEVDVIRTLDRLYWRVMTSE